jgi:hypothetical protein
MTLGNASIQYRLLADLVVWAVSARLDEAETKSWKT